MYGLLGKSLGHSFSKDYFTEKFSRLNLDYTYQNIELDNISKIVEFVHNHKELKGFNVTVPYKESIIPYLDDIDETAKEVGAVNTVKVYDNGKLKGFNTDVIGFKKLLDEARQQGNDTTSNTSYRDALIYGSGGASKAVQYVLRQENIPFKIVSRNAYKSEIRNKELGIIGYDEINSSGFAPYSLIINATPVGMFPNIDECLGVPFSTIEPHNIFIDLIYNPKETLFLKNVRLYGAAAFNGLTMLHEQAEAAWEIWGKMTCPEINSREK